MRQSLTRRRGYIKFFRGVCDNIWFREVNKNKILDQSVAIANIDEKNKFKHKSGRKRLAESRIRIRLRSTLLFRNVCVLEFVVVCKLYRNEKFNLMNRREGNMELFGM